MNIMRMLDIEDGGLKPERHIKTLLAAGSVPATKTVDKKPNRVSLELPQYGIVRRVGPGQ